MSQMSLASATQHSGVRLTACLRRRDVGRLLRDRERRRERLETDAGSMANGVQALAEEAAPQDASQRQYDSRDQTFLAYCQSQSPGNSLP